LPPAVATDQKLENPGRLEHRLELQGLVSAVRLLRSIGHPRAEEFAAEAEDFKATFVAAYRKACRAAPRWTDARGRRWPLPPTALYGQDGRVMRHPFYFDTGPLFLVFAGLLDADDPAMQATVRWFREGPVRRFNRFDASFSQPPVIYHEVGSAEGCYSWNPFLSHQLGDRTRFLEGMYSLFAGSMSRKTWISCETRGGITGTVFAAPLAIHLARLAVIDDELRPNELHLLRFMPLAWLGRGQEAVFERMPTVYGPVTLRTRAARDGRSLDVTFKPAFRQPPGKIVLHVPPLAGLRSVRVNGKALPCRGKRKLTLIAEDRPEWR